MKKIKKQLGFTLVELLVVIAVIGILSTLAVVSVRYAQQQSRDAKRASDISAIRSGLSMGYTITGDYPVTAAAITLGGTGATILCVDDTNTNTIFTDATADCMPATTNKIFMEQVPANPSPNGADYSYIISDGTDYGINFTLEGDIGDLSSGPNCAKPGSIKSGAC